MVMVETISGIRGRNKQHLPVSLRQIQEHKILGEFQEENLLFLIPLCYCFIPGAYRCAVRRTGSGACRDPAQNPNPAGDPSTGAGQAGGGTPVSAAAGALPAGVEKGGPRCTQGCRCVVGRESFSGLLRKKG